MKWNEIKRNRKIKRNETKIALLSNALKDTKLFSNLLGHDNDIENGMTLSWCAG